MLPFINTRKVLQGILGWGGRLTVGHQRVMVLAGGQDTLMRPSLMARTADGYVRAYRNSINKAMLKSKLCKDVEKDDSRKSFLTTADGVRFVIVDGAGHHLQNDLQWEEGAKQILSFINQL